MEREQLRSFDNKKMIYRGEHSLVFKLPDSRILKVVDGFIREQCELIGTTYERKILDTSAKAVSEIVRPITAVYDGNVCCGFTSEEVGKKNLNNYDINFTAKQRSDLKHYDEMYSKLEDIVVKANKVGIVIPDLCTCDNTVIMPDGSLKFIDYDGMQFGKDDRTFNMSTSLGDPYNYVTSKKYCDKLYHFTSELDKTSLTILMFLWVFNIDLTMVGAYNPMSGNVITLPFIFKKLGLEDEDFMYKVNANISSAREGYYLKEDLHRIAQNYDMQAIPLPTFYDGQQDYVKKLVRK